jgi:hypothetical protein
MPEDTEKRFELELLLNKIKSANGYIPEIWIDRKVIKRQGIND